MPADERPGLRRIVAYSLASGLAMLIPIPILDDWARDLMRRRLVAQLGRERGVDLDGARLKVLACGYSPATPEGCLKGCLVLTFTKPLTVLGKVIFKKVVHRVLFFLLIKDAIDTFSRSFHEAYLIRHALGLGAVPASEGPEMSAAEAAEAETEPGRPDVLYRRTLAVRHAIEATCDEVDPRPIDRLVRSAFQGSWRLLAGTARQMARILRRRRNEDEESLSERLEREGEARLGGLIDELADDLGRETTYLARLARRFEERLWGRA